MELKNKKLSEFKSSFIELTQQASNLEGIGLTYGQTKDIIESFEHSKTVYSWQEVEVVRGVMRAYQYITDIITSEQPITYRDLQNINRLVNEYETSKESGDWRKELVKIGGTSYIPPLFTSSDYIKRIERTLEEKITFSSIVQLYADIAKMQFFKNGNKRSALCFCNAILIRNELDFIKISSTSKFTDALVDYYEDEKNFTRFLNLVKKSSIYNLNSEVGLSVSQIIISKLMVNNMSEADLAKKLSVNRSYINQLISSKKSPSIEMAKKIGKILGFDWKKFFNQIYIEE